MENNFSVKQKWLKDAEACSQRDISRNKHRCKRSKIPIVCIRFSWFDQSYYAN